MIQRELTGRILKLLGKFPSVAILGPRQIGKTTLAKNLIPKINRETVYLDLELPVDFNRLSNPQVFFENNAEKCIIIDEIQRMPDLFPVLRAVIDMQRVPGRFVLLGSASPDLLKKSSETLTGRIVYTELSSLLISEVGDPDKFIKLWLKGGFPEPFLSEDKEFQFEWFQSFIRTYIERDLPLLGLRSNPVLINRLLNMLSQSQGMLLNLSGLSKSLGVSIPTLSKYVDFLKMSFILRRLPPWFSNIKKRLVKTPKVYIRDTGLLHHLLGIENFNFLMGHPIVGFSWEGFVLEQVINSSKPGFNFSFYRTSQGAECDLVISKGLDIRACIEVKFTESPSTTKSFTTSIQDLNSKKNFIIVPKCPSPYELKEGIIVCEPNQFIDNFLFEL
jgi:uncharacterized protein